MILPNGENAMNEAADLKENRLGSGPLIPTWFRLSLPVVLGSIVTIVYNLADTYFIAQTGNALLVAGVSVCSPPDRPSAPG